MSKFYEYFKENMDGLGLPAPVALFGNAQTALGTTIALVNLVDKFGRRVTVFDLIGAGTRLEQLSVASACLGMYYVGAVIGSLAVATGRTVAGGTSLADIIFYATSQRLARPWLTQTWMAHPQLVHGASASVNP